MAIPGEPTRERKPLSPLHGARISLLNAILTGLLIIWMTIRVARGSSWGAVIICDAVLLLVLMVVPWLERRKARRSILGITQTTHSATREIITYQERRDEFQISAILTALTGIVGGIAVVNLYWTTYHDPGLGLQAWIWAMVVLVPFSLVTYFAKRSQEFCFSSRRPNSLPASSIGCIGRSPIVPLLITTACVSHCRRAEAVSF